jgi:hypothetical protein
MYICVISSEYVNFLTGACFAQSDRVGIACSGAVPEVMYTPTLLKLLLSKVFKESLVIS